MQADDISADVIGGSPEPGQQSLYICFAILHGILSRRAVATWWYLPPSRMCSNAARLHLQKLFVLLAVHTEPATRHTGFAFCAPVNGMPGSAGQIASHEEPHLGSGYSRFR